MRRFTLLTLLLFQFLGSKSFAQVLLTKDDSISIARDSVVKLFVPEYRGTIQWQKSPDGEHWIDLVEENSDTLQVLPDEGSLYRAEFTEGTCLPVYSDSAAIISSSAVSSHFMVPADSGLVLISDSAALSEGIYRYFIDTTHFSGIDAGWVVIDEASGGHIRKVEEAVRAEDTVTVFTSQATMEDLFYDISFKLSTEELTPEEDLKNASLDRIREALTDDQDFIHPYKVVYQTPQGKFLKSALHLEVEGDTTIRGGILYQKMDFSDRYLLYVNDEIDESVNHYDPSGEVIGSHSYSSEFQLRMKVTEGYFAFDPVFKFEFDFDAPTVNWSDLSINQGELRHFKFYSDSSKVDYKARLLLEATEKVKFEVKKPIYEDLVTARYYFLIPPGIPAMIEIGLDILAKLSAEVTAAVTASTGFQHTQYATLGAEFKRETGWESISDLPGEQTVEPLEFSGNASLTERLDIYPRVDVKMYDIFGPFLEILPYISGDLTYSLDDNWDSGIDLGADGSVGVEATILGETLWDYNAGTLNIFNYRLYQMPDSLVIIRGDNQTGIIGEPLPLSVRLKVKDRFGYAVPDVKVYFNPLNGSVADAFEVSGAEGIVSTAWTLSDTAGVNQLEVFIKNGKDEVIEHTKLTLLAEGIITVPEVETLPAENVDTHSVLLKGAVTFDGGGEITERGFYWSLTDVTPDMNDNTETVAGTTGTFEKSISGLQSNTTYYYRAFATNSAGTSTGPVRNFKTQEEAGGVAGTFTDARDGSTYNWVKIGDQVWMAENLAYLPSVSPSTEGANTSVYFYVFDYQGTNVETARQDTNYTKYGALYNWPAALEACPAGWHLPGDAEWEQLAQYISDQLGPYGKSQDDWTEVGRHLKDEDWGGTDDFGFSALPGGYRTGSGYFNLAGDFGYWWSATTTGMDNHTVWMRFLTSYNAEFGRTTYSKNYGLSVRCVKD